MINHPFLVIPYDFSALRWWTAEKSGIEIFFRDLSPPPEVEVEVEGLEGIKFEQLSGNTCTYACFEANA